MIFNQIESGTEVSFKLGDVVCPTLTQMLEKITSNLNLTGKVIQLSDAGEHKDFYAVIQVKGILNPLIVPLKHIEPNVSSSEAGAVRDR